MARKVPTYMCFDYDNDRDLKVLFLGQCKNEDSPFDVIDHSITKEIPGDWTIEAERKIKRAEVVLVIVGPHSHTAQGVLKEVELGRKHGKKVVQVIGYKDASPTAVPNAGRLYKWTHENLAIILQ